VRRKFIHKATNNMKSVRHKNIFNVKTFSQNILPLNNCSSVKIFIYNLLLNNLVNCLFNLGDNALNLQNYSCEFVKIVVREPRPYRS
jgi:hypothetical protein